MPKIVDHEERRRELIVATWRVITRAGLSRTTMRHISEEAGYSSGTVAHYFDDKQDILARSLEAAHEEVRRMFAEATEGHTLSGLSALREYMLACLPLDEHRRGLAAVEVAFWGEAIGTPQLIDLNEAETDGFFSRVKQYLDEARQRGEIRHDIDVDRATLQFRVLMDGLSIQSVVYRGAPSAQEQIDMLDDLIGSLSTGESPGPIEDANAIENPSASGD